MLARKPGGCFLCDKPLSDSDFKDRHRTCMKRIIHRGGKHKCVICNKYLQIPIEASICNQCVDISEYENNRDYYHNLIYSPKCHTMDDALDYMFNLFDKRYLEKGRHDGYILPNGKCYNIMFKNDTILEDIAYMIDSKRKSVEWFMEETDACKVIYVRYKRKKNVTIIEHYKKLTKIQENIIWEICKKSPSDELIVIDSHGNHNLFEVLEFAKNLRVLLKHT